MKRLLITLLLSFLAVAAVMAWRWGPTLFPSSSVSDLYLRYEHNPHIRATDIRNFRINDTLRVDVTLLQADSDSAWYSLLLDFGASDELIELYKSNKESFAGKGKKTIILYYIDIKNQKKRLAIDDPNSRVVIGSLEKRTLGIFLTDDSKIKNIIRLTKIKNLKNGNQI